jgi:hypothetical protein
VLFKVRLEGRDGVQDRLGRVELALVGRYALGELPLALVDVLSERGVFLGELVERLPVVFLPRGGALDFLRLRSGRGLRALRFG